MPKENFTLDGSNFGGRIDIQNLSAVGTITISVGEKGDFQQGILKAPGSFVLDASQASTGNITIAGMGWFHHAFSAETLVMSMGLVVVFVCRFGRFQKSFVLDASEFAGSIGLSSVHAASDKNINGA